MISRQFCFTQMGKCAEFGVGVWYRRIQGTRMKDYIRKAVLRGDLYNCSLYRERVNLETTVIEVDSEIYSNWFEQPRVVCRGQFKGYERTG